MACKMEGDTADTDMVYIPTILSVDIMTHWSYITAYKLLDNTIGPMLGQLIQFKHLRVNDPLIIGLLYRQRKLLTRHCQ